LRKRRKSVNALASVKKLNDNSRQLKLSDVRFWG
jgi:hypothetical protein